MIEKKYKLIRLIDPYLNVLEEYANEGYSLQACYPNNRGSMVYFMQKEIFEPNTGSIPEEQELMLVSHSPFGVDNAITTGSPVIHNSFTTSVSDETPKKKKNKL